MDVYGEGPYYLWFRWAQTMGSHFISINSTIDLGTGVSPIHPTLLSTPSALQFDTGALQHTGASSTFAQASCSLYKSTTHIGSGLKAFRPFCTVSVAKCLLVEVLRPRCTIKRLEE